MRFSEEEINSARRLREAGLAWEPRAGHYVYDQTGFCKQTSPFQEKVYFILNYDYFMKSVGGVDRFKQIMLWLPTWYDARQLLETLGVPAEQIVDKLQQQRAIEQGRERFVLYEWIESSLVT
ncbi:hypothetical protein [Bythopirellula polymerisocia]|uniref:Uncharacterized protein n=1 Tax=Bythopirellula polymerisocia TaxID=2528003 RepID=A0A5C6D6N9_9BACT|nr:hypothetical protein [Bythopirellula polymerisocia]TWU30539.1 hypothetical protein Pla144_13270 [Bythopirellula polymerisocia]